MTGLKKGPKPPFNDPKRRAVLVWGLALAAAALAGLVWSYCWRVFFYLDSRCPALWSTAGCVGFCLLAVGAVALVRRLPGFAARGAACILLCGVLFAFANPPLQTPDETDHYLRTYAISLGRFDFDYDRTYPEDVARLVEAFPGAWVNAHTSVGIGTDPDTGEDKPYDTAGYALKQIGSDGAIQSVADSFAAYFSGGEESPEPLHEPVSFLILPFLPGAAGMALVRLLGGGALACLYAGRLGNLLAYTLLCGAALHLARRYRPVLLCVMLLPLSLFMGASLSYDATLLACYYLMLALLSRPVWTTRTAAAYAAACVFVNVAKPYLNLLWALLPLVLLAADAWRARGRRWLWSAAMAAGALAATLGVETYGRLLRRNYPVIARQGGQAVDGMAQLLFVLHNPLRTLATFWGTLYENEGFVGQLGIFGWKDLPIPLLNLLGPVALGLAVLLASAQPAGLGRRRALGLGGFGAVYAAGAMAAMYITYTPVAMVRIVGLQARYFLPVFLALALVAVAPLRRLLAPQLPLPRAERLAVPLFAGHALLGAVLLFQHYFVGPFYTIPA
ncbi:DUF2142 domain-containing protein [uncultured Subdoligranulum sp.]|uniref:DUF2142 domain-containing protein n=1 Tax=uncultured Subdoligranulum sp. TaxID=512298 RepID=UPI0025EC92F6|nr:DUF2142 domain-containing protein [uncultured Subdoligranulum sp.]